MSTPAPSRFAYFLVAEGNDPLLKEEIARCFPSLKLAYSRKTFLTFKISDPELDPLQDLGVVFAYSSGLSLGRAKREELVDKARELLADELRFQTPPILNSFLCKEETLALRAAFPGKFKEKGFLPSDLVFEVIQSHENEYYFGVHRFGKRQTVLNDYFETEVPSRAYYKLREAFQLVGLSPAKGERALDLGSSPGGASYFLLQNGVQVTAIDPKDMHELCKKHPLFKHHRIPFEKVGRALLGGQSFDWIAIDVNLDPTYVSHELERILGFLSQRPKGLFFTVKLTNKFSRERIPEFVRIIEKLGFEKVLTKQVPSDRSEFLLFAEGKPSKPNSKR